jgi:carbohydrate-binding DOMON domain-containing protein
LGSPPRFIDTLPDLNDLLLLEGCSAGSIAISYSTCIVFGTWLGFTGEAKWREVKQREARRRGARGGMYVSDSAGY